MPLEVSIRTADNTKLNVNGTDYIGSSTGHGTGTAREFHIRSNADGKYVCWCGTGGTRYAAKGILVGATSEPQGSVWIFGTNSLRFAHGGSAYRIDQVQFKNNISGTNLLVYLDSGRTTLMGTIAAGATLALTYTQTYYLRSTGTGTNPVSSDYSVTLAKAGHLYNINGTYVQGTNATYTCACSFNTSYLSNTCSSTGPFSCQTDSDGGCSNAALCQRICSFSGTDGFTYLVMEYTCQSTLQSSATNGSFSSGPTVVMAA
jgi:hypothetical protein